MERKIQQAIKFLQEFQPSDGYYLAFSGGKDSVVVKHLLDLAGCKYNGVYRVTSVDPPELVKFIKEQYPEIKREVPRDENGVITMWNLIPRRGMPPTYKVRYCCEALKESGGDGHKVVTGVRWAESLRRKENSGLVNIKLKRSIENIDFGTDFKRVKNGIVLVNDNDDSRRIVEFCYTRSKTTFNPIVSWSNAEVWQFILKERLKYCDLYNQGFDRLGCIGCPLAYKEKRKIEFERWPKYKDAYIRAFQKLSDKLREQGKLENSKFGPTGETMFNWWMKE